MLNRTLVPQSAARLIQDMIQSGELAAGQKIPSQREFSTRLGISRASLREALLTLETLGLIKTEAGRGTFVADRARTSRNDMAPWRYSSSYSVFDVFQTRIMLEGSIASLAAGRLTGNQLQAMEAATKQMEECWAKQDLLANVEADLEFHAIIASACSNAMMRALYDVIRAQLTETQRQPIPITEPARMQASIAEHRRIISALRDNDPERARKEMETHVLNTARCAGLNP
ncbi:GntR family transcriptional regulator [Rhizobium sp. AC44/96]|uniref:FadR/GntR family transcriptional regulator n=1 Tax=Rhizobium sp. AC44/96 TaxID=1841654 RepID=UPI00080FD2BC|nr:FadR/GntR family transcriptional regulator [Rhizobium sp. AC44/96]OCJ12826.1 GntR family transcriptional regulator [Rhizobium sp. AC44/96]